VTVTLIPSLSPSYDPTLAPPGKTVIQATLESDFDRWCELKDDRGAYLAEKARVATEILERLEPHFPGLRDRVERTDVATPWTFVRYTHDHRGAFEDWLPTMDALMKGVPNTPRGLQGFHRIGQWVVPGGGVTPALFTGRHLLQKLCHERGRRFVVTFPA
jgi:phytoene desaturase